MKLPKPPTMCSLYCFERDQIERSKTHTPVLTVLLMHSVYDFLKISIKSFNVWFMLFGRSVKCRNWCWMSNIFYRYLFKSSRVLQFVAHSRYQKGALTQKRSFSVICFTFRSDFHVGWKNQNKHSTLNSSFEALSKWH